MKGSEAKAHAIVPLSADQIFELLEATVVEAPSVSISSLLYRVESMLLRNTGATRVDVFLVNRWFNKLFRFSLNDGNAESNDAWHTQNINENNHHQQQESDFNLHVVYDIGEGVAGIAAETGKKLRVRDCSAHNVHTLCPEHTRGSLVCWPVRERVTSLSQSSTSAIGGGSSLPSRAVDHLEDIDCGTSAQEEGDAGGSGGNGHGNDALAQSSGSVLAVLQLYSESGELPEEAIDVVRDVERLLAPLLTDALAFSEENMRRRTMEALHSLDQIVPKEMGLIEMVEEVVSVAERLLDVERVCLFFVDEVADELWVAKSIDFDGATIKVGHGLCGSAAATGLTVNVIDSYSDSRFDAQWDKKTGFVTKRLNTLKDCMTALNAPFPCLRWGRLFPDHSVLCVPIPSPDLPSCDRDVTDVAGRQHLYSSCSKSQEENTSPRIEMSLMQAQPGSMSHRSLSSSSNREPWSSGQRSRSTPIAVLEVLNKKGGGVFDEHEEKALVRVCASVESLLRRKAAEVALLKSDMTERSWIRRKRRDYAGPLADKEAEVAAATAPSNYARAERTIMRLYSETASSSILCDEERLRPLTRTEEIMLERQSMYKETAEEDVADDNADARFSCGKYSEVNITVRDPRGDNQTAALLDRKEADGGRKKTSPSSVDGDSANTREECKGRVDWDPLGNDLKREYDLLNLNINIFELSTEQQLSLVVRFYRSMGLMETFKISNQKLRNFVYAVEKRYHANSYHNFSHATSVIHAVFVIIETTRVKALLRPLDKLALLTAAFCHDIDHPGNSNAYQVNSLSRLALLHGDSSVLERHHIYVAFEVLLQDGGANNILSELTDSQFKEARKVMIQAILATDMSTHIHHCAELAKLAQRAKNLRNGGAEARNSAGGTLGQGSKRSQSSDTTTKRASRAHISGNRRSCCEDDVTDSRASRSRQGRRGEKEEQSAQLFSVDRVEDRLFLCETVLHCADLAGQVLDTPLAEEWGKRVLEEFSLQAELEAQAGLPLTAMGSSDPRTKVKAQHFFLTRIVRPLWGPFVEIFPELEPFLVNLDKNCDYYQQEVARFEEEPVAVSGDVHVVGMDTSTAEGSHGAVPDEGENKVMYQMMVAMGRGRELKGQPQPADFDMFVDGNGGDC